MPSRLVALGAALGLVVLTLASSTPRLASAQTGLSTRPAAGGRSVYGQPFAVHPRDMIQVRGYVQSLSPGQPVTVYTVPQDRWLVIVPQVDGMPGFAFTDPTSPGFGTLEEGFSGQFREVSGWDPGSVSNGDPLSAFYRQGPAGDDGIGWVFRPGSDVLIRLHPAWTQASGASWNLFGYLVSD